jgi:outer membrane immunogenic protein
MKKLLLALIALGAAAPALAADLGARPTYNTPVYAAPIYNWTGFYIGGHVGGAFSGSDNFNGLVLSNYSARLLGGVQAGGDWQFAPNWVVGVEGQYSWLGKNNLHAIFPGGLAFNNDQRALGSITGRVGYTWGPGLVYVKGGYAYSDNRDTLTFAGATATPSAPVSNTCSPRIGRPRPSINITTSAAAVSLRQPRWSRSAPSITTSIR